MQENQHYGNLLAKSFQFSKYFMYGIVYCVCVCVQQDIHFKYKIIQQKRSSKLSVSWVVNRKFHPGFTLFAQHSHESSIQFKGNDFDWNTVDCFNISFYLFAINAFLCKVYRSGLWSSSLRRVDPKYHELKCNCWSDVGEIIITRGSQQRKQKWKI